MGTESEELSREMTLTYAHASGALGVVESGRSKISWSKNCTSLLKKISPVVLAARLHAKQAGRRDLVIYHVTRDEREREIHG
jgi:hypothetical protein